jgi:hypothetical protein
MLKKMRIWKDTGMASFGAPVILPQLLEETEEEPEHISLRIQSNPIGNKKFWEDLIAYLSSIGHGPHIKRRIEQFPRCRGNVFTEPLPSNNKGLHGQTHRHSFDTKRTSEKKTCPKIPLLLRVYSLPH